MIRRIALALVLLAAHAVSAAAQDAPARPRLSGGADPNDWESYYDHGVRMLNGDQTSAAAAAFYWAARLDPTRAEPLYASRVAIFRADIGKWERYMRDDPRVLERPEMRRADSLMAEAWLRNPFVPTSLNLLLYNQLPGDWRRDFSTRGWLAFAERDIEQAARFFERAVEANPGRLGRRLDLAQALVLLGRFDQAATQLEMVLNELRARDEAALVRVYESKEMFEYALGLLHLSRRRPADARVSLERAVMENAGAYQAHRGLALVARVEGKKEAAVEEYARAVEIAGEHPLLAYEYAVALIDAGRPADAAPLLARLVEREPYWAVAHLQLGRAHDSAGSAGEAVNAYARYLQLAPRGAASTTTAVRARIDQLKATAGN